MSKDHNRPCKASRTDWILDVSENCSSLPVGILGLIHGKVEGEVLALRAAAQLNCYRCRNVLHLRRKDSSHALRRGTDKDCKPVRFHHRILREGRDFEHRGSGRSMAFFLLMRPEFHLYLQ